jgi:hypothetical protein
VISTTLPSSARESAVISIPQIDALQELDHLPDSESSADKWQVPRQL